ncbi:hypothetical protein N0V93_001722 [Gnomoniopsis smithogilvyi]|uniref:NAD(P)-binding protein n=1 Tax=Gnomoniopsis smithogilvyi TaxID=1191159 RepID=A0A9W8Z264_9PEZI|nr:hypothetical protein N0V93_001722 [Gnomoniopsis smithogilvyi]
MSVSFSTIWTQLFPPRGPFNESNLPSQAGKVFVITGGSSGLGLALTRILYGAGGKVYILTRSKARADKAISEVKASYEGKTNTGSLAFISMDLNDFETVKSAALEFLDREGSEGRLDVLFNNAGTGGRKNAPKGAQGYEYHMTINVLGGFILTQHLLPILTRTAALPGSSTGSVRVVCPASVLVEMGSPKSGIHQDWFKNPEAYQDYIELYSQSKVAVWFLQSEFARRQVHRGSGVLFIAGNPGTYNTNMWQYTSKILKWLMWPILRDLSHASDTYLWMGFSDLVTMDDAIAGRYAMCDGRWHPGQRADLISALRSKEEGGTGRAAELYEWCENVTREFL